ncbi:E3 ubiquitin-protein ligase RAD18 isoform X2 [Pangasianodon hypophthalmus]|uniref:E3 ubiquitin-protein ligase RAD18 isoform X2 n=1 Tax=Pangasianodon hypophthalmus TaxID=310915 RepID=UPI00147B70B0|nr:E3 ubiquitin-protein ligase RAD18 isoform X2 [Pangasianodon hypophthalmus]
MSHSVEADLPPHLSCLKNIDTLLRCPICFDFLNISMMTQCSHNFCSLCIRKFLSYKLLCPLCNTPLTEQELRNNRLLDDLVQSFQAARQQLSQTNFESPPISPKTPTMAVGGKAARQKALKKEGTILTHFFQKRAPINSSIGAQSGSKGLHPVKQEPMDVCVQGALLPESAVTVTTVVKEEKLDMPAFPSTSQDIKPVAKVECPVCGVEVSQQHINKHLDTCLTRGEKKDSLRRSDQLGFSCSAFIDPNSRKRRPMAKLVYTLLTMVELKRRLRECHLSTQGSREQLIRRHQEFIHIYNAQCDALNPRSSEDIAREVENNEKMRNQLESKNKPAILITKNHTVTEIEQLHSDYRKQHSGEFSRLIAQVRGRLENSRRTQIKQEGGKSAEELCCSADDTVVQNTPQPPGSLTLEIATNEKTSVMELGSRSPSPTLSEVSVSRVPESGPRG